MTIILRLQGLPWSANSTHIREFFVGLSIPDGGVHIVGGETGDVFIAFSNDEDARKAMQKQSQPLCGSIVSILLSSKSEMQEVIAKSRTSVQTRRESFSPQQTTSQTIATSQTPESPITTNASDVGGINAAYYRSPVTRTQEATLGETNNTGVGSNPAAYGYAAGDSYTSYGYGYGQPRSSATTSEALPARQEEKGYAAVQQGGQMGPADLALKPTADVTKTAYGDPWVSGHPQGFQSPTRDPRSANHGHDISTRDTVDQKPPSEQVKATVQQAVDPFLYGGTYTSDPRSLPHHRGVDQQQVYTSDSSTILNAGHPHQASTAVSSRGNVAPGRHADTPSTVLKEDVNMRINQQKATLPLIPDNLVERLRDVFPLTNMGKVGEIGSITSTAPVTKSRDPRLTTSGVETYSDAMFSSPPSSKPVPQKPSTKAPVESMVYSDVSIKQPPSTGHLSPQHGTHTQNSVGKEKVLQYPPSVQRSMPSYISNVDTAQSQHKTISSAVLPDPRLARREPLTVTINSAESKRDVKEPASSFFGVPQQERDESKPTTESDQYRKNIDQDRRIAQPKFGDDPYKAVNEIGHFEKVPPSFSSDRRTEPPVSASVQLKHQGEVMATSETPPANYGQDPLTEFERDATTKFRRGPSTSLGQTFHPAFGQAPLSKFGQEPPKGAGQGEPPIAGFDLNRFSRFGHEQPASRQELPPRFGKDQPPRAGREPSPRFGNDQPPKASQDLPPQFGREQPPRASQGLPPRFGGDQSTSASQELPPRFGEDQPPRFGEDQPPRAGLEPSPRFRGDRPPRAGLEPSPRFGNDQPPGASQDPPPTFGGDLSTSAAHEPPPGFGKGHPQRIGQDQPIRFGMDQLSNVGQKESPGFGQEPHQRHSINFGQEIPPGPGRSQTTRFGKVPPLMGRGHEPPTGLGKGHAARLDREHPPRFDHGQPSRFGQDQPPRSEQIPPEKFDQEPPTRLGRDPPAGFPRHTAPGNQPHQPPNFSRDAPPRFRQEPPRGPGQDSQRKFGHELPPRLGQEPPPRFGHEQPPRFGHEPPIRGEFEPTKRFNSEPPRFNVPMRPDIGNPRFRLNQPMKGLAPPRLAGDLPRFGKEPQPFARGPSRNVLPDFGNDSMKRSHEGDEDYFEDPAYPGKPLGFEEGAMDRERRDSSLGDPIHRRTESTFPDERDFDQPAKPPRSRVSRFDENFQPRPHPLNNRKFETGRFDEHRRGHAEDAGRPERGPRDQFREPPNRFGEDVSRRDDPKFRGPPTTRPLNVPFRDRSPHADQPGNPGMREDDRNRIEGDLRSRKEGSFTGDSPRDVNNRINPPPGPDDRQSPGVRHPPMPNLGRPPVFREDVAVLEGLPPDCKEHHIVDFFRGLRIVKDGIRMQIDTATDRKTGRALVQFFTTKEAAKAFEKDQQRMGRYFIIISKCLLDEWSAASAGGDKVGPDKENPASRKRPLEDPARRPLNVFGAIDGGLGVRPPVGQGPLRPPMGRGARGPDFRGPRPLLDMPPMRGPMDSGPRHGMEFEPRPGGDREAGFPRSRFPADIVVPLNSKTDMSNNSQNEHVCLEIKGLPFDAKTKMIVDFFDGIQIARGTVFVEKGSGGKVIGSAYLEIQDSKQIHIALRQNGKLLNGRQIDVSRVPYDTMLQRIESAEKRMSEREASEKPAPAAPRVPPVTEKGRDRDDRSHSSRDRDRSRDRNRDSTRDRDRERGRGRDRDRERDRDRRDRDRDHSRDRDRSRDRSSRDQERGRSDDKDRKKDSSKRLDSPRRGSNSSSSSSRTPSGKKEPSPKKELAPRPEPTLKQPTPATTVASTGVVLPTPPHLLGDQMTKGDLSKQAPGTKSAGAPKAANLKNSGKTPEVEVVQNPSKDKVPQTLPSSPAPKPSVSDALPTVPSAGSSNDTRAPVSTAPQTQPSPANGEQNQKDVKDSKSLQEVTTKERPALDVDQRRGDSKNEPLLMNRPPTKQEEDQQLRCVSSRNIPYKATENDIVTFFDGLRMVPGGVRMLRNGDGSFNGQCFVEFASEDEAAKAMDKRHSMIGGRIMQMSLVTRVAMMNSINSSSTNIAPRAITRHANPTPPPGPRFGGVPPRHRMPRPGMRMPNPLMNRTCTVIVSNLNEEVGVATLIDVFAGQAVIPGGIRIGVNTSGRPLGEAKVILEDHNEAIRAIRELNGMMVARRPIRLNIINT